MLRLLEHKIRFGNLSYGPLMHTSKIFDLLIEATEELSYELGYTVEEIVASGGVPYAPVAMAADISQMPRYEDTLTIDVEPIVIGENHIQLSYRLGRGSDGAELGRVSTVQGTITPEGVAEPGSGALRDGLEAIGLAAEEPIEVEPRGLPGAGLELSLELVFRTPHLEGAGLGYFEDYARQLSICLEEFLEARGSPLGSLSEVVSTFVSRSGKFTIDRSTRFDYSIELIGEGVEI